MTESRLHRMTEQDGHYTCRDCPAAGRSAMELSRIPCVPREETDVTVEVLRALLALFALVAWTGAMVLAFGL